MNAELILAINYEGGIGYNNNLPWICKEELDLFRQKTLGKTLVVGRKTGSFLPKLKDRQIICLTRNSNLDTTSWKNQVCIINNLESLKDSKDIMIAGGKEIYELALNHPSFVNRVHMSIIKGNHECDTYFSRNLLKNFIITEKIEYKDFTHYILERTTQFGENQYLELLRNILSSGERRTCRNGDTISIFKSDMTFDLRNGFPLLTSKKMFLRGILEEILFFLRGDTDTTILSERGVKIWEANTSEEFISSINLPYAKGVMGPMYGYQWRFFNSTYKTNNEGYPISTCEKGVDQLKDVVHLIKTEPNSRRILMTSYNPAQAKLGVLYPCHSITIQFYVQDNFLDMFCYNRSQDAFLGVPFNIASSALLLMIVCKLTDKIPRFLYMTMGDTHIYSSHINQVETQLLNIPYVFPTLSIPNIESIEDIEKLEAKDFILSNYQCYPSIKAEMVA